MPSRLDILNVDFYFCHNQLFQYKGKEIYRFPEFVLLLAALTHNTPTLKHFCVMIILTIDFSSFTNFDIMITLCQVGKGSSPLPCQIHPTVSRVKLDQLSAHKKVSERLIPGWSSIMFVSI